MINIIISIRVYAHARARMHVHHIRIREIAMYALRMAFSLTETTSELPLLVALTKITGLISTTLSLPANGVFTDSRLNSNLRHPQLSVS